MGLLIPYHLKRRFGERHPITPDAVKKMQYELTRGTYDEDRAGYYAAFDEFDASGNLKPLIAFFKQECVKTRDSALKREMKDVDAKKSGIEARCKESLKEILEAVEKGENSIV